MSTDQFTSGQQPGIVFSIEYVTTRDRVVDDYDCNGNHIGWTCSPDPPEGQGWQIAPSPNDNYKTRWRRFVVADPSLRSPSPPAGQRGGLKVIPFRRPYAPDPRNGEVYATEMYEIKYVDGVETETFAGFDVVHMAYNGDSPGMCGTYETLEEAQAAAVRIARERNAMLS